MTTTTSENRIPELRPIPPRRPLRTLAAWIAGAYMLLLILYILLRLLAGDQWWWLAFLHNFVPYYFLPALVLLPLALLVRAWGTAARLLPVLLVGWLWFNPLNMWSRALFIDPTTPSSAPEWTIITFNSLPANQRIDAVIDWIRQVDADLVLLQEIMPENAAQIRTALAERYPQADDQLGTQLTLSRYTMRSQESVDLGGWFVRRMTLDIDDPPFTYALYNVHLTWPVADQPHLDIPVYSDLFQLALKYDETERNRQIRQLLQILSAEELPFIVAGDFNMSDQTLIYGEITAVMNDSWQAAGQGFGATWPAARGEEGVPDFLPPMLRLDYVWHSDDFRPLGAWVGPELGSDHLPLLVRLQLGN